jgi:hypothetical protein
MSDPASAKAPISGQNNCPHTLCRECVWKLHGEETARNQTIRNLKCPVCWKRAFRIDSIPSIAFCEAVQALNNDDTHDDETPAAKRPRQVAPKGRPSLETERGADGGISTHPNNTGSNVTSGSCSQGTPMAQAPAESYEDNDLQRAILLSLERTHRVATRQYEEGKDEESKDQDYCRPAACKRTAHTRAAVGSMADTSTSDDCQGEVADSSSNNLRSNAEIPLAAGRTERGLKTRSASMPADSGQIQTASVARIHPTTSAMSEKENDQKPAGAEPAGSVSTPATMMASVLASAIAMSEEERMRQALAISEVESQATILAQSLAMTREPNNLSNSTTASSPMLHNHQHHQEPDGSSAETALVIDDFDDEGELGRMQRIMAWDLFASGGQSMGARNEDEAILQKVLAESIAMS